MCPVLKKLLTRISASLILDEEKFTTCLQAVISHSRLRAHYMTITFSVLVLWLHLIAVIVWAGGFLYLVMAFIPALNEGGVTPDRAVVMEQAVARFRRVVWLSIGLLVITGFFNILHQVQIGGMQSMSLYMRILTVKLIVVLGLIVHHATRAIEPRSFGGETGRPRFGLKSPVVVIVTLSLFLAALLLGLILRTL